MGKPQEKIKSSEIDSDLEKEIQDLFELMKLTSDEERQNILKQGSIPKPEDKPEAPIMIRLSNSSEPICTKE